MDATSQGSLDAKALVRSIARDLGHVEDHHWEGLAPAVREAFKLALRNKDDMIASAVSTLAKNLYTSNARFVFELLQNAEDNVFQTAKDLGRTPFVAFRVYHNRIVIECNEDGFTEANLRAICNVGKSSKIQGQGYIGEKGIGFKSVFMAAWKVHIQSNDLSFSFIHRANDAGIGMVTPLWEEVTEELERPLTRMTLYLHDTGDQELLSSQRETIRKQFGDLQETLLLFMSKLKEIRISFYDENGEEESSTTFSSAQGNGRLVKLTRVASNRAETSTACKFYLIIPFTVEDLPKNENRHYSNIDEEMKVYATAEVRLGFPVSPEGEPIIEPQDVFAFLPVRQAGFSFIIQSDFVTQANRQDIVTTSLRNQGIRSGIADAFVQTVLNFSRQPRLQYTWARYLPNTSGHQYDAFWEQLIFMIKKRLLKKKILLPWSERGLRRIDELRYLQPEHVDSDGSPLLNSEDPEIYLSNKYKPNDVAMLAKYGLRGLHLADVLSLVGQDLDMENSRIKSRTKDVEWQDRVAKLLLKILEPGAPPGMKEKLKRLRLLPLTNGNWVSSGARGGVYFSKCAGGCSIPTSLDLNLLHVDVEDTSERRRLAERLGVCHASVDFVRKKIFAAHQVSTGGRYIISSVTDLRYIYLTHNQASGTEPANGVLRLVDDTRVGTNQPSELYLPDKHMFGTHALLGATSLKNSDLKALKIRFIHPFYLKDNPTNTDLSSPSWEEWLHTNIGLRRLAPLVSNTSQMELSKEVTYVAKHWPQKFLGFLHHHWPEGGQVIEGSDALQQQLSQIKVPCHDGESFALNETYLPVPKLVDQCARFMRGDERIPLLELPATSGSDSVEQSWAFLMKLGVGFTANMKFYLDILFHICSSEPDTLQESERIIDLFSSLYGAFAQSSSKEADEETIL